MRLSPQSLILAGVLAGCSDNQSSATYEPQTARSKVVAALPAGWAAIASDWQQQSDTTKYFNDPRTAAFVLVGPQSRHGYSESRGEQHREDIFREAIFVWIVPSDFSPTFPQLPLSYSMAITNVFSSSSIRVYANVENYIADTNRWQQLMNELGTNRGSIGQPMPRVSWKSWIEDIAAALKK